MSMFEQKTSYSILRDAAGNEVNISGGALETTATLTTSSEGFSTTTPLGIGATFTSSVISLIDYTVVQTSVNASHDGTITIDFCEDAVAANIERTLTIPYVAANGFQLFSAPCFTQYVRYKFENTSGVGQTNFYYTTKLLKNALNPQILGANAFVSPSMASQLNRSILTGQNKAGNYINIPVDSEGHLMCHIHDPRSAFGQMKVAEETTLIQISFPYYISSLKVDSYNLITNVSVTGGTGTSATVSYDSNLGSITKVVPYTRGSGYTVADTLTIQDGTDNDATVKVSVVDDSGAILAFDQESIVNTLTGKTDPVNTITQTNNMLNIKTEASANRAAIVRTKNRAKYQTGTGIVCRFTGVFNTGTANNNQYIGIADENNGFLIGYQGTTFGIQVRRNGAETSWIPITSFNVDVLDGSNSASNPSGISINPQNGNVFQIKYQWLGFGAITFSIEDPDEGDFEPFHIIRYAGTATQPSIFLPTLPLSWEVENTSNTSAIDVFSASGMVALEGKINYQGSKFSASNSASSTYLFSIRNKRVFKDKVNIIEGVLRNISIGNDANSAANYKVYLNASITAPTWSDVDSTNSCFEVDTTGSYGGGGTVIANYSLAKDSSLNLDIKNGDVKLEPGDILTIESDNALTQAAAVNWIEYE